MGEIVTAKDTTIYVNDTNSGNKKIFSLPQSQQKVTNDYSVKYRNGKFLARNKQLIYYREINSNQWIRMTRSIDVIFYDFEVDWADRVYLICTGTGNNPNIKMRALIEILDEETGKSSPIQEYPDTIPPPPWEFIDGFHLTYLPTIINEHIVLYNAYSGRMFDYNILSKSLSSIRVPWKNYDLKELRKLARNDEWTFAFSEIPYFTMIDFLHSKNETKIVFELTDTRRATLANLQLDDESKVFVCDLDLSNHSCSEPVQLNQKRPLWLDAKGMLTELSVYLETFSKAETLRITSKGIEKSKIGQPPEPSK